MNELKVLKRRGFRCIERASRRISRRISRRASSPVPTTHCGGTFPFLLLCRPPFSFSFSSLSPSCKRDTQSYRANQLVPKLHSEATEDCIIACRMRSARSATATDAGVMPIALAARFGSFSAFKSPKPPSFVASTASRGPETWCDQVTQSYAERRLVRERNYVWDVARAPRGVRKLRTGRRK